MANIGDTWDEPFEAQLKAETFISRGDNTIRNVRRALEERFGREHDLDLSDQTNHGRHPQMSTRTFLSKPSTRPDGTNLDASDKGKIAISGGKIWVWGGAAWVEAKARYLSSNIWEIHATTPSSDESMGYLAKRLNEFSIAVGKLIACRFYYHGGGTKIVKGGWIDHYSSEAYRLYGMITAGGSGLVYASFGASTTTKWRQSFGQDGSYPGFYMVIQG